MKYIPDIHHRRSIRLKGYDYSQTGTYFITICVKNRQCLFGEIVGAGAGPCACPEMVLNDAGRMVQSVWNEIPKYYFGVDIDAFQIMPNHVHGIIVLVGAGPRAGPDGGQPRGQPQGQPRGVAPTTGLSLPDVVHRFKTMTTKRYIDGVKQHGWPRFGGKLWQRNYYEHIIRNDTDLQRIREYIENNPTQWDLDKKNPADTHRFSEKRFG